MARAGIKSILRNSAYLFGSQAISTLLRVSYVVLLARSLGPRAYGTFNYALAWYLAFIALTYLGLDIALGELVGRDRSRAHDALFKTLTLRVIAATAVAFLSYISALWLESDPSIVQLIAVFSIGLIGRVVWLWAVSAFTAFEVTTYVLRFDMIFRPLEAGLALVAVLNGAQLIWLAVIHAGLWWCQAALGLLTVTKRLGPIRGKLELRETILMLRTAVPASLYTIVTTVFNVAPILLFKQFDQVGTALGQFTVAYQACGYLLVIPYLFFSTALPVLARSRARGDRQDLVLSELLLRGILIFGTAAILMLGTLVSWAMLIVFGKTYTEAGELMRYGMWLIIPFAGSTLLAQLFFIRKLTVMPGIAGVGATLVMGVSFGPAVQAWGGMGAMLSVALALTTWAAGLLGGIARYEHSFPLGKTVKALAVCASALVAFLLTGKLGQEWQALVSLASLTTLTLILNAFTGEDVTRIRALVPRRNREKRGWGAAEPRARDA